MIISRKWERLIQDVRSYYRVANADSDHILEMTKIRIKIAKKHTQEECSATGVRKT